MLGNILMVLVMLGLVAINTLGVLLVVLQLPGTWLICVSTLLVGWMYMGVFGKAVMVGLIIMAILGEIVEFLGVALGAGNAKGSRRSVILAVVGGMIGGILGMIFLAFIPLIGALIGAAAGGGIGSILGDLWAGREWHIAFRTGRAAAAGRFWGALGKVVVAMIMWLMVVVALLWP